MLKGRMEIKTILIGCLLFVMTGANAQYLDGGTHAWGDIEYDGDPWVFNVSRPYLITKGLQNRHLSLWASHGRYYNGDLGRWKWQRPNLFCTTEDLFTQTIVVPYLIPMLQNAGAIVFTPRERDWQTNEVIVDNDDALNPLSYQEDNNGKRWKKCDSVGFARRQMLYSDGENPFRDGTVRQAKATKRNKYSEIVYQPKIPETGRYAVYVSYQTLPKSVPDAKYIVYHQGQATEFTVNQRMGGGTWVYLGTFEFDKGCNEYNRVVVTNHSSQKGVVTSDAVRFGGGMGNIVRGDTISGLPRCLEGARYYAQWAGVPYNIYSTKKGESDYGDDINVRSLMTNWLGGGSCYMPAVEGKRVPIELALAIHSDAGYAKDGKGSIGSLAVCTTDFNDGIYNSGISRMTSYDFAKALLHNNVTDMRALYGNFNMRYLWDRNYSETRMPEVPSAILETLSHQNFPDMKLIQDPGVKFNMARSIYKTILRYVSANHGKPYVVQPLSPKNFSVEFDSQGKATLSWNAQIDSLEPTAKPTAYLLYIATGTKGFDNGTVVRSTSCSISLAAGVHYKFKVAALNAGGESFPSETLSAYFNPSAKKTVLIVNNFHRLASPQVVDNDTIQGFDMNKDPGVTYGLTAGWNGKQQVFDRKKLGGALGICGDELVGQFIAGNDFNYTVEHANAISYTKKYNIASCSAEAVLSGKVRLSRYNAVDLINGLERNDGYTHAYYKSFTPKMQMLLRTYAEQGGGALLVSGSYIGSDMMAEDEKSFLQEILKLQYMKEVADSMRPTGKVYGLGLDFDFHQELNAKHYAATHPELLEPADSTAFCAMKYDTEGSAAVAYRGSNYRCFTMGFPFECIKDERTRRLLMSGILTYLLREEKTK